MLILVYFIIQGQLAEHEAELHEMNSNSEKLQQSYNELLEFKLVLSKVISTITKQKECEYSILRYFILFQASYFGAIKYYSHVFYFRQVQFWLHLIITMLHLILS